MKRTATDYDAPVVGFKDNLAVVKPKKKTLVVQMDAISGKKFLVVKGKKVEVKEVMKVKKKTIPLVLVNKTTKTTSDAQTSTDDFFIQKTIAVQTECDTAKQVAVTETETNDGCDFEFSEGDDGYIIRDDVVMGHGPKCPTPHNNYYERFEMPPPPLPPQNLMVKANTRQEQILSIIRRDLEDCECFDRSGNMFVLHIYVCRGFPQLTIPYFRPIHCAVIENNLDMVWRQCIALKYKRASVNISNYNELVSGRQI